MLLIGEKEKYFSIIMRCIVNHLNIYFWNMIQWNVRIAIKLLFDPAEPIHIGCGIKVQGLFESRQVEVSDEVSPA